MSTIGLYLPGASVLHRAPAGWKLLALVACGAGSVLLDHPWQVGVAVAVVLAGYLVAGLSPRTAAAQARPLLWVLVVIAGFQLLVAGWERAVVVAGVILFLVLAAALVTLTTRTTDLIDTIVRAVGPLRRVGVDPDRVGLLMALGVRSVPVVVSLAEEVRDAQRARGLTASPTAFAVPLIVRSLRHADALGEALRARGVED